MGSVNKCILCGVWTNFGHLCSTCTPKPLDEHDKVVYKDEEEVDEYYETYRPSNEFDVDFDNEDYD